MIKQKIKDKRRTLKRLGSQVDDKSGKFVVLQSNMKLVEDESYKLPKQSMQIESQIQSLRR
jgi:hypothetical protein